MADATTRKLLGLLEPRNPLPLRCAAALVLAEVGAKDEALARSLCATLDDPDAALRAEAMAAVGKLKIDRALPQLLARVKEGGLEAETAAGAAARLGSRGIRALQALMAEASPVLRRLVAAALAASGTASAETAAVEALLDPDPGVVDAAARTLLAEVPSLGEAQRRAITDRVLELLPTKKKSALPAPSEAALIRLLSALGNPKGQAIFWSRAEPQHPAELRAAALQALGKLPPPADAAARKRLLACAADPDIRVAAPALLILQAIPVQGASVKDWLPLLAAPDLAARRFAIDKLAGLDTPELARALLDQLQHPDAGLRQQALDRLAQMKHGREALAARLLEADSPDEAWKLARAQASFAREYPAALRARLFNQACKCLETEDRRADALLFLLREADARDSRDRLAARALAVRKKKKYADALMYLRLLGRDPACGEGLRFELAACGLKVSPRDLSAEARAADPCLHQFSRLVHSHETDPLAYLSRAAWLGPEDLFYLGFHFVEGKGPERDFGAGALRLLVKRKPASKLAKDAKRKLASAGMK